MNSKSQKPSKRVTESGQRRSAGPGTGWTRRRFVQSIAHAGAAAALPIVLPGCMSTPTSGPVASASARKKVALLATEVRKFSHAQHFVDRLLEGYGWEGRHHVPSLELAGLYVDQFPEGDLARDRARRHNVKLYPSVAEALTLGTSKLAVDGVLIIGEHGRYPKNDQGQTLYPRYRWFKEIVKVFESSGRAVPVFNDKHLSTRWAEAKEMVDDARRLRFAFLAGSSLPVTWRIPSLDLPWGAPLMESVCAGYGGVDSYDFHGLETAQCMSERRVGGETGIESVLARRGADLWKELETRPETARLLQAALARSHSITPPSGYSFGTPTLEHARKTCGDPVAYFIQHRGGFSTTMFLLNGLIQDFNYAGRLDSGQILSTQFHLPMPPRMTTLADFFNPLMHHIEACILSQKAPYPVERTLLTTGMTAAGVASLARRARVDTPEMNVAYQSPAASTFWRT